MWIFSKRIQKIIDSEVAKRREEIKVLTAELDKRKEEYLLELASIQKNTELKQQELADKHREYEAKIADLDILKLKVENEIQELTRVRNKAEGEQKRLWERLDILRDNLNTEDVWIRLWEAAYAKATDAVWAIMQKETLHLVDLAEQRAYTKAKIEFDDDLNRRMEHLAETANNKDSIPFIRVLALKKTIEDIKLNAERVKNIAQTDKCSAQLEILEALL